MPFFIILSFKVFRDIPSLYCAKKRPFLFIIKYACAMENRRCGFYDFLNILIRIMTKTQKALIDFLQCLLCPLALGDSSQSLGNSVE
ncbi:hypothetical protein ES705_44262 [subsurface metagenome]